MFDEFPQELARQQAQTSLEDTVWDVGVAMPAEVTDSYLSAQLDLTGFALAHVLMPSGELVEFKHSVRETEYTRAIFRIWEDEMLGKLPEGSHDQAIDDVLKPVFETRWARYL